MTTGKANPRHGASKYNATRHETIVTAIRNGNYRGTAARLAAVDPNTVNHWLRLGRDRPDEYPEYAQLAADVELAEAECEAEMVGVVRKHALSEVPGAWTAAMTYLERTKPDRFGKRDTTVIEGGKEPIKQLSGVVVVDERIRSDARSLLRAVANSGEIEPERPRLGLPAPAEQPHEPTE
jgi:hypothetical protein